MLIDVASWPRHRPWVIGSTLISIAAVVWYFTWSWELPAWPGGASVPGFTFGVAGGLLILFEMLLWWRKKVRAWRIGTAQAWMCAHIWLGLTTVPLLVLHSGFRLGGPLSTVLMILFLLVIASGVWGLVMQNLLPNRLLEEVAAETIYSQIDRLAADMVKSAQQLVDATCGPAAGEIESPDLVGNAYLTTEVVRSAGGVRGKVLATRVPLAPIADAEPLREFFTLTVLPYLRQGRSSRSLLIQPNRSASQFREARTRLVPAAHEAIDLLEQMCEQRRQFDHQARLHFWLHNWLCLHLPLSAAMFLLMLVHIWVALIYW